MIVIVDYGMGNLKSVYNAFCSIDADVKVSSDPRDVEKAERIILPGVGAFGDAMGELASRNLIVPIMEAIDKKTPFLGICLGLQLLYKGSEEDPGVAGLGYFDDTITKFSFDTSVERLKVPHMGWNDITLQNSECPLMKGISNNTFYYFVHSYYARANDNITLATANYGIQFSAMVWKDNVFAAQFHPEKSQNVGLTILKNFMEI